MADAQTSIGMTDTDQQIARLMALLGLGATGAKTLLKLPLRQYAFPIGLTALGGPMAGVPAALANLGINLGMSQMPGPESGVLMAAKPNPKNLPMFLMKMAQEWAARNSRYPADVGDAFMTVRYPRGANKTSPWQYADDSMDAARNTAGQIAEARKLQKARGRMSEREYDNYEGGKEVIKAINKGRATGGEAYGDFLKLVGIDTSQPMKTIDRQVASMLEKLIPPKVPTKEVMQIGKQNPGAKAPKMEAAALPPAVERMVNPPRVTIPPAPVKIRPMAEYPDFDPKTGVIPPRLWDRDLEKILSRVLGGR